MVLFLLGQIRATLKLIPKLSSFLTQNFHLHGLLHLPPTQTRRSHNMGPPMSSLGCPKSWATGCIVSVSRVECTRCLCVLEGQSATTGPLRRVAGLKGPGPALLAAKQAPLMVPSTTSISPLACLSSFPAAGISWLE